LLFAYKMKSSIEVEVVVKFTNASANFVRACKAIIYSASLFSTLLVSTLLVSTFLVNTSVQADELLDPLQLDSKPSLMWLSTDVNVSSFTDSRYNSFLSGGEFWSNKWGVSASLLQNDSNDVFGLPQDSEYLNLDVKRRFGGLDKSNLQLGLGWQELNIDEQLEASGPKLSLSGRLNIIDNFKVYGATSYFPELDDSLNNNDAKAYEIEAGLLYQPIPSVSLKAGYRVFELDLEDPVIEDIGSSSGFLFGTDFSW